MRTNVEIDSETAAKLIKIAEAQHVSVEQLLADHVPGLREKEPVANGDAEVRVAAFDEWVEQFSKDAPVLSEKSISRSSIYGDR
jgi:hypothetical protein